MFLSTIGLHLTVRDLKGLRAAGLPHIRPSKKIYYYDPEAVTAWINSRKVNGGAQ